MVFVKLTFNRPLGQANQRVLPSYQPLKWQFVPGQASDSMVASEGWGLGSTLGEETQPLGP